MRGYSSRRTSKYILALIISLLTTASPTPAAVPRDELAGKKDVKKSDKAILMELDDAWRRAVMRHDAAALDGLLAKNFLSRNTNGQVRNRKEYFIEVGQAEDDSPCIEAEHIRVRIWRDTAVVSGIELVSVMLNGQTFVAKFRYSHNYLKDGRRWKATGESMEQIGGH